MDEHQLPPHPPANNEMWKLFQLARKRLSLLYSSFSERLSFNNNTNHIDIPTVNVVHTINDNNDTSNMNNDVIVDSSVPIAKSQYMSKLNSDILFKVVLFLTPKELCLFRRVDRFAQYTFLAHCEQYWAVINKAYANSIPTEEEAAIQGQYAKYLHNKAYRYEQEMKHVRSIDKQYQGMAHYCAYQNSIGIYSTSDEVFGLLTDLM